MTINDRIKHFRKDILKINQTEFAKILQMKQTGVSAFERKGGTVTDRVITSICEKFNLNEDWLRNGNEPMYAKSEEFDLDSYVKSKGASEIELQILKAYFDLDPDIRDKVMESFKKTLNKSDF